MSKEKKRIFIDGYNLKTEIVKLIATTDVEIAIKDETFQKINRACECLDNLINNGEVIYGVNTNMGGQREYLVPIKFAEEVQMNLLNSVASNVGKSFSEEEVRAAMISRLNGISRGHSGLREKNFRVLLGMINHRIHPIVPEKGSLGTSGDLGPLAAIALCATGQGMVRYKGEIVPAMDALTQAGLEPMKLTYKEGLALINCTSMMSGVGSLVIEDFANLILCADLSGLLSVEALRAKMGPFEPLVHEQKPHIGQQKTAAFIYQHIQDSEMAVSEEKLQKILSQTVSSKDVAKSNIPILDYYSLRCIPQVHGPAKDIHTWAKNVLQIELNSSCEDPFILPEEGRCLHNGHFHGQYISMAMDQIAVAATVLGLIADRRIDLFLDKNHSSGLPGFLAKENPGTRLGLMGCAFLTASLLGECKAKCTPISIQSLPSTEDFQDFVSLGLVSTRRTRDVIFDVHYIFAAELICSCQAIDIRGPAGLSKMGKLIFDWIRTICPYFKDHDVSVTPYVEKIADGLRKGLLKEHLIKNGQTGF